jgi:hypothetical protein
MQDDQPKRRLQGAVFMERRQVILLLCFNVFGIAVAVCVVAILYAKSLPVSSFSGKELETVAARIATQPMAISEMLQRDESVIQTLNEAIRAHRRLMRLSAAAFIAVAATNLLCFIPALRRSRLNRGSDDIPSWR